MKRKILNSQGKPIVLTDREQRLADYLDRHTNALGYEIDTTTLTTISKKITEQKFFEVAPADYVPIRIGQAAWSSNIITYRDYALGDKFESGLLDTGSGDDRMASADTGIDSLSVKVRNWGKRIGWSLIDLQMAAKAGNWDLVTAKEKSRKKNWDLGIQKVAFLGIKNDPSVLGLLTQSGITTDTTTLPQPISTLGAVDLKAFVSSILNVYRANAQRTAWPTHFIIPESDYLGLVGQASADFPVKSVLQLLEEALQVATKNPGFKILPLAYADFANSGGVLTKQRYTLLNYQEESVRMDIPVDYTNTLANSTDNFFFYNVGYGQFTGVQAYRPREMYYLDCNLPG